MGRGRGSFTAIDLIGILGTESIRWQECLQVRAEASQGEGRERTGSVMLRELAVRESETGRQSGWGEG